jgi:hypothetical protein
MEKENNIDQKEILKPPQDETKNEEQPKLENPPKEIPLKTEMCQLIFYDFTVK